MHPLILLVGLEAIEVDVTLVKILVESAPDHELLLLVQQLVKCTEYDRLPPGFHAEFKVDRQRVDELVSEKHDKQVVILLLDSVVKRRLSPLVTKIEIEYRTVVTPVDLDALINGLKLPLPHSHMERTGLQGVNEI